MASHTARIAAAGAGTVAARAGIVAAATQVWLVFRLQDKPVPRVPPLEILQSRMRRLRTPLRQLMPAAANAARCAFALTPATLIA